MDTFLNRLSQWSVVLCALTVSFLSLHLLAWLCTENLTRSFFLPANLQPLEIIFVQIASFYSRQK